MRILGIESSCDETAAAIVEVVNGCPTIIASAVSSQANLHAKYGGVVPEVAARSHMEAMIPILMEVGVPRNGEGIDAVAVTAGPGLLPALRVGVEFGKALAWGWNKPLVPVNHLEGHVYSVWARPPLPPPYKGGVTSSNPDLDSDPSPYQGEVKRGLVPEFPTLVLLVSGKHTELVLMEGHGAYKLLGASRDDASGEAFDKVARMLGLGYPGGPIVSKLAKEGSRTAVNFPRPMLASRDFDFSFSGLKTAVAVYLDSVGTQHAASAKADICASFEEAVVDTLTTKTLAAVLQYHPKSVIVAGGVSANRRLREELADRLARFDKTISLHLPDLSLTGDNAAMIAIAGAFRFAAGKSIDPVKLVARASWHLAE